MIKPILLNGRKECPKHACTGAGEEWVFSCVLPPSQKTSSTLWASRLHPCLAACEQIDRRIGEGNIYDVISGNHGFSPPKPFPSTTFSSVLGHPTSNIQTMYHSLIAFRLEATRFLASDRAIDGHPVPCSDV